MKVILQATTLYNDQVPNEDMTVVSATDGLPEKIGNFLYGLGFPACEATKSGILQVLIRLANYEEEGRKFSPRIILSTNHGKVVKLLPQVVTHKVGTYELSADSYARILKKVATLAQGDWHIYLERLDTEIKFGLVQAGETVLSLQPEDHLSNLEKAIVGTPIALIKQVAPGCVELKSSYGPSLKVSFNGRNVEDSTFISGKEGLVDTILTDLPADKVKAAAETYMHRIFQSSKDYGHGALVVVVNHSSAVKSRPYGIEDAIWLPTPIDLVDPIKQHLAAPSPETANALRANSHLALGMLDFDGITVFSTAGSILGYNAFVKPTTKKERDAFDASQGGARTRAYNLLSYLTEKKYAACFMLSQDGGSSFKRK